MANNKSTKKKVTVISPIMEKPVLQMPGVEIVPDPGKPNEYGRSIVRFKYNNCNSSSTISFSAQGMKLGSDIIINLQGKTNIKPISIETFTGIGTFNVEYDITEDIQQFRITDLKCSTTYKDGNTTKTVTSVGSTSGWAIPGQNFQINGDTTSGQEPPQEINNVPDIPGTPRVKISGLKLTASLDYYDEKATYIRFRFIENDNSFLPTVDIPIVVNGASTSIDVAVGRTYKVQCAAINTNVDPPVQSSYSSMSDAGSTIPGNIGTDTVNIRALSPTSCEISWAAAPAAESYTIEYTYDDRLFGQQSGTNKEYVSEGKLFAIIQDIQTENGTRPEWYFRVQANNSVGSSEWTIPKSIILGSPPGRPTTWQERTMVSNTDTNRIYWTHNAEDNSIAKKSEIEITIQQPKETKKHLITINGTGSNINYYDINMAHIWNLKNDEDYYLDDGTIIYWRIRTLGVLPEDQNGWGDYSVVNEIGVFQQPLVTIGFFKSNKWWWDPFNFKEDTIYTALGDLLDPYVERPIILESYPINITITTSPTTQKPLIAHLSIISKSSYKTNDYFGDVIDINVGDIIYETEMAFVPGIFRNPSRFLKQTKTSDGYKYDYNQMIAMLMPTDLQLENFKEYRFKIDITTDHNLSASTYEDVQTNFTESFYDVACDIVFDEDSATAVLHPYCTLPNFETGLPTNQLVQGVSISIFRKTFDGTYDTIATEIPNTRNAYVLDPHPALDYGRYRFIIKDFTHYNSTIFDPEMIYFGQKYIMIQWDDQYKEFDSGEDITVSSSEIEYRGSWVKLPWNIDISEDSDVDVEYAKYIGRSNPVSYYGTQIGQTCTWNTVVPVNDNETIFSLRRLMRWTGNCYVREPRGVGYLANVKVSFSITHREVLIPVTLNITRVEEK